MSRRPALTLVSSVAGASVVALDGTVLTVAQPTLQRDLGASFEQVQWTSTAYLVAVAGLLVLGGRLGDRHGHRPLFAAGMLGFGAASAGIALAPGIGWVIALRALQGVCGALLQPATLGMLRTAFPPERLGRPIAVRTAAIALSAAAGPVAGGALVTTLGWRAVFLLGVGPALLFGLLALALPRDRRPRSAPAVPLGLPGALLLAVALGCAVDILVTLPGPGWTAPVVAAVAGTALVRHERRTAVPLLPPGLAGSPAVTSALLLLVAASAALSGTLFVTTYVLQDTLGLAPLDSALRALPLPALMILAASLSPVLSRCLGERRTVPAAAAVLAAGALVLARETGAFAVCAGFALLGAGFGTVMVAATQVVVREAAASAAGVAGGLQQTAMNVGPALGVAVAVTLRGSAADGVPPSAVLGAVALLAGAAAGRALPGRRPVTGPGRRERAPASAR
ncbi:MFS transporter [Streptomyces anandii JCM 4720]|nr:MFS transporter [Streptomyces anandii JCM 4720]